MMTQGAVPQWRDISTAPKDGTRIMAWWNEAGGIAGVAKWDSPTGKSAHWTWDGMWSPSDPTHWMPLPPPPEQP